MRSLLLSTALLAGVAVEGAHAQATAWELDPTFAEGGYTTNILRFYTYPEFSARRGRAIAKTPDGRTIVAADMVRRSDGYVMIGLAELDAAGNQTAWGDPHDGHDTYTLYDPVNALSRIATIKDLAISSDGQRIHVLAEADLVGGKRGFDLYTFDRTGQYLRSSAAWFERNGYASRDVPERLRISPTGKLIAIGTVDTGGGRTAIGAARFNADGSPDVTFGNGGKVVIDYQGMYCNGRCITSARDVAFEPTLAWGLEPGFYVVGSILNPGIATASNKWLVGRMRANGTPNTAFASNGFVFMGFGGNGNEYRDADAQSIAVRGILGTGLTMRHEVYVAGTQKTAWSRALRTLAFDQAGNSIPGWGGANIGGCAGTAATCRFSRDYVVGRMTVHGGFVTVTGQKQEATGLTGTTGPIFSLTAPVGAATSLQQVLTLYRRPGTSAAARGYGIIADDGDRFLIAGDAWSGGSTSELYPAVLRVRPSSAPAAAPEDATD